jgi:hypothetical protein
MKTSNGTYPDIQVHPDEPDSGIVAIIAIAVLSLIIILTAVVNNLIDYWCVWIF